MAIDLNPIPQDSGTPRVPYTGPAQPDTSAPTAPNVQPDQSQQQMISPISPAQQPQAPTVSAPPVPPSPNQRLHSFVSSVLSGIGNSMAGKPAMQYSVDPATGKMTGTPAPRTTGQAWRTTLANGLTGLAAGAQVPQQKSGLASALAGLGAGAGAQKAEAAAIDDKARKQANEDAERQAQTTMRKYDIARANALTYTTWAHDMREEDAHDPQRQKYNSWADAAEQGGLNVQRMSAKDAEAAKASDPHFIADHIVLPGGYKPQQGPDGQVLMDPQSAQPLRDGQVIVIQGAHMLPNGQASVPLPKSMVDDMHKYGNMLGITNAEGLKAGDEVDADHFFKFIGASQEGNKKTQEGWLKPTISVDDDGNKFEKNSNTGDIRPAKAIPTADAKNIADANKKDSGGDETHRHNVEMENIDRGKLQVEKDKAAKDSGPTSNLTGEDYLKTLPTSRASMVKAVGEGRQVLPANRKEALAILEDVHQAYPDWDESLGKTWPKTRNEYMGSGKTATQIVPAYNTALEHMQALFDNTTRDGIFNPLSKAYQDRQVELGYVTREVGKAVSAGAMTQKESEDLLNTLASGMTPGLRRERVTETAKLLHDKIDEYQTKFNQAAPSTAVNVPLLISPKAADSYDYLRTGGKQQPAQQQNRPVTGQPQQPAANTPPANLLKEGVHTQFKNGQVWTLQNGQPVQVQGQ